MSRIRFTRDAEADLRSIVAYTIETHGARQMDVYQAALRQALTSIADNPQIGADRSVIRTGSRRYMVEQHAIYYEVDGSDILVLRILGVKQDPGRHL